MFEVPLPAGYFLEEQLDQALKDLIGHVKDGLIHLSDLEALIQAAEYEKARSERAAR